MAPKWRNTLFAVGKSSTRERSLRISSGIQVFLSLYLAGEGLIKPRFGRYCDRTRIVSTLPNAERCPAACLIRSVPVAFADATNAHRSPAIFSTGAQTRVHRADGVPVRRQAGRRPAMDLRVEARRVSRDRSEDRQKRDALLAPERVLQPPISISRGGSSRTSEQSSFVPSVTTPSISFLAEEKAELSSQYVPNRPNAVRVRSGRSPHAHRGGHSGWPLPPESLEPLRDGDGPR